MYKTLEEAKDFFTGDKFATECADVVINKAEEGYAECSFKVLPKHLNADGFVMGGALYTIADLCFACAANFGEKRTVTLNSQINFFAPSCGKEIFAVAKAKKRGRTVSAYEVEITDDTGKAIAYALFTGYTKG